MANEWVAAGSRIIQALSGMIKALLLNALDTSLTNSATVITAPGGGAGGWIEVLETPKMVISALGDAGGNTTIDVYASDDKVNEVVIAAAALALTAAEYKRAEFEVYTRYIRVKAQVSVAGPLTGVKIYLTGRSLG